VRDGTGILSMRSTTPAEHSALTVSQSPLPKCIAAFAAGNGPMIFDDVVCGEPAGFGQQYLLFLKFDWN